MVAVVQFHKLTKDGPMNRRTFSKMIASALAFFTGARVTGTTEVLAAPGATSVEVTHKVLAKMAIPRGYGYFSKEKLTDRERVLVDAADTLVLEKQTDKTNRVLARQMKEQEDMRIRQMKGRAWEDEQSWVGQVDV